MSYKNKYKVPKTHTKDKKKQSHYIKQGEYLSPLLMDMTLQRTIGNQEVQRMFKTGEILAKLYVSQPGDIYEQEADRIAGRIISMGDKEVQLKSSSPKIQKKGASLGNNSVSSQTEAGINSLKGKGQHLEPKIRDYFHPRFGVDLSDVRVHTDSNADRLARAVRARAFTYGNDVVFAKGEYKPETREGKRLMAHEFTHVVQQRGMNFSPLNNGFIQKEDAEVFGSESWAWKIGFDLLIWAFNFLVVENYDDNVIMEQVQKYSRQKVLEAFYFFLTTEKDYFHLFPTPGFGHDAPQRDAGYDDFYDDIAQTIFDIHGTKFDMGDIVLRLWKGDYHVAGGGGEIGFYGDDGRSPERNELEAIGLKRTTLEVYLKNGILIGGYDYDEASFWTTSFNPITNPAKEDVYTVNTLEFETAEQAQNFAHELEDAKREALIYPHNHNESIDIVWDGNRIVITWGKPEHD